MKNSHFKQACQGNNVQRQFFLNAFYDQSQTLQEVSGGLQYWLNHQDFSETYETTIDHSENVQKGTDEGISFTPALTILQPEQIYGKTRPRIYILPSAFDQRIHKHLGEFVCSIVDHEGQHAREFSALLQNPFLSHLTDLYNEKGIAEMELRAYDNQIKNFDKRRCSEEYRRILLSQREHILRHL